MHADQRVALREIAAKIARDVPGATSARVEAYEADAYLCPNCWVKGAPRSQLYFVAREEVGDRLRCDACHSEFVA